MSAPEVTVIDYGVGNLLSVQRGLEHSGAKVTLTAHPEQILAAKRVVLPGVPTENTNVFSRESFGSATCGDQGKNSHCKMNLRRIFKPTSPLFSG
jgi:hypothetical protein